MKHYEDKQNTWTCLKWGAIGIAVAVVLALLCGCCNRKVVYGVGSYGRHSVVPRLGLEGDLGRGTHARAVWLPELPVYAPGEPHQSSRAPSRELGAFELEFTTEIP